MQLKNLQALGLSEGQIKVYAAVLELGISSLNKIQEKTGIERRNIYDILNKLIEKGLVSYTLEKGKRTYQCTHPNKLKEEIENKKEELKELEQQIPQITGLFNISKPEIRAEIYRGTEAMKTIFNEMLDYKEIYWMGGTSFGEYKAVPKGLLIWFEQWMKRRVEKKIIMRDLVDYGTWLKELPPNDIKSHKKSYYKYCQLPKDLQSPLVIAIYGDKVAQILWKEQSFAFVLESKEIRDGFMKYFNYFWKEPW